MVRKRMLGGGSLLQAGLKRCKLYEALRRSRQLGRVDVAACCTCSKHLPTHLPTSPLGLTPLSDDVAYLDLRVHGK